MIPELEKKPLALSCQSGEIGEGIGPVAETRVKFKEKYQLSLSRSRLINDTQRWLIKQDLELLLNKQKKTITTIRL